uniref:Uncharacterized protein n=1 Tax=Candidatus Kentrum sp. FM TaxID=2126340 RepID=A0A450WPG6_9GAMM|nr:MAG: hypothetical protein BECKFM1743A_GA0114220_105783 [Candidatus Kentron sp. FM]VFJ71514.1 MAG: hypothetical protein BECKFM1743C_GA0114222_106003 [Candidatus Kentron sp. FM]VFK18932.1 MAG: hypothetical protein BECKFM1743B_GA0114221_105844 [Candidatus Kentron sp. FM]
MMWQDPIVAETRALRDEYAREFNYSIDAIFDDLMLKQALHPERVVSFPARRPAAGAVLRSSGSSRPVPCSPEELGA